MLDQLGWNADRQAKWDRDPRSTGDARIGRVTCVERGHVTILTQHGAVDISALDLAVGDWVATDGSRWVQQLPRETELTRQTSGRTSNEQVLAANVDTILIVEPCRPAVNLRRIERMLTLAWASGATPVVLLSKYDLDHEVQVPTVEAVAPGVTVLPISATTGAGMDRLRGLLGVGLTFVTIGPSGAGKSTLVNALAGEKLMETSAVRADGKGRHTTTRRELVIVDGLGCLIDSPGVRSVGMTSDHDGIEPAFVDIVTQAAACRFADCTHSLEPGCAVLRAVQDGDIDGERLASFQRIQREVEHQARRKETHDRSADRVDTKGRRRAKRTVMNAKGRDQGR